MQTSHLINGIYHTLIQLVNHSVVLVVVVVVVSTNFVMRASPNVAVSTEEILTLSVLKTLNVN